jgi:dienelactone hydrolase
MKSWLAFLATLLFATAVQAQLHTETVEYKEGGDVLEGYLAYSKSHEVRHPGVLVVPEWWGLNDYARSRAESLARLGYVAFVADMYGNGAVAKTMEEAAAYAGKFKKNRQLMRNRAYAALNVLRDNPLVDPKRIAAIGYCFGGMTVLELARNGAHINGVVSFHGGLDTPNPADAQNIKCKVLVCAGANDPFVPPEQVAAFEKEMRDAHVDWQLITYGGAVHSFTNPNSGDDPSKGIAYNEAADKRSWEAMKQFFGEIFKY